jgi:hypothetical protein
MSTQPDAPIVKPECIVLDTNAWIAELFLRSALGAALIYHLRQTQGVLGLPEVIERELTKHAAKQTR